MYPPKNYSVSVRRYEILVEYYSLVGGLNNFYKRQNLLHSTTFASWSRDRGQKFNGGTKKKLKRKKQYF